MRAEPDLAKELICTLFERDYDRLCRVAFLITGDPAQAEDVVQEAFLRTFTTRSRLRDLDRADAYLRRIVVNLCRSRLRRRSIERRVNATVHLNARRTEVFETSRPDAGSPLLPAVQALPVRQRTAVVLHYYTDMSQADVAIAMGCSEGTVKSQLSKARSTLARALDDQESGND